jgi:hypothetical protein
MVFNFSNHFQYTYFVIKRNDLTVITMDLSDGGEL